MESCWLAQADLTSLYARSPSFAAGMTEDGVTDPEGYIHGVRSACAFFAPKHTSLVPTE